MFFLFLLFPVLEIYLLFKVGAIIGVANTFFYLLASAVVGIGLIRTQGVFLLRNAQASLAQGQVPTRALLHSILIFLSGALFVFPGFLSDGLALFLLLPGSRHFTAHLMKRTLAKKMSEGSIRFASSGFGFSAGFANWPQGPAQPMRDVSPLEIDSHSTRDVIDVTPSKKD